MGSLRRSFRSFLVVALMLVVVAAILSGLDLINGGFDYPSIQLPGVSFL
jgi:hypothetical protein